MNKRLASLASIGAALIWACLWSDMARAERRVALVVGNSGYQMVPKLPNPSRDANAVAKMFRDAGFDTVDIALDVGNLDFKRAIRRFEATADQADIAVLYYAGHGIELSGINYLIPTDARLASDRDAEDEAIPLERLVSSADGARKLRIVILDACRDNPFTVAMRRERRTASRGVTPGLGKAEPTSIDTLIAYAAKAGSTADDGDGLHSPFTSAILKNLTVPGLDIRLAFGRVRDEVMKATGNRQEPFVYGSLGGGNISLVPAPAVMVVATQTQADIKGDFDLVAKIGTRRAWEVFLTTYPTGFYADLARAQLASLPEAAIPAPTLASVNTAAVPPVREIPSREQLEWDRIKDSSDQSALERFIKRFPDAPLAITAQRRLDVLKEAARERVEKARAEREAALKAAEEARQRAEQERMAREAQKKREESERRAREAEEQQKAKAIEAERKALEAKQRAEEAERAKQAIEAARLRAESERKARLAEDERRKAEAAAAAEAVCKQEQDRLELLVAKGSDGTTLDDVKALGKTVRCERLRPQIAAAVTKLAAEAEAHAAKLPNAPPLIRAAQLQLTRIGCAPGKIDGTLNAATKAAFTRYLTVTNKDKAANEVTVTEAMVDELTKQTGRICPLECKVDEVAKGDLCVAVEKPAPVATEKPAPVATRRDDDEPRRKRPAIREAEQRRPAARPVIEQRSRVQAYARPSGSSTIIGVGF